MGGSGGAGGDGGKGGDGGGGGGGPSIGIACVDNEQLVRDQVSIVTGESGEGGIGPNGNNAPAGRNAQTLGCKL
ncbi:MAG TPA: hypothetical protein P5317_13015 [Myxococcota bacterium]|nr:hypothetical protein [Myxococcota bacterium]